MDSQSISKWSRKGQFFPHAPVDLVLVDARMQVTSRGTKKYGTILPAIVQAHRDVLVGRVHAAATTASYIMSVQWRALLPLRGDG